MSTRSTRRSQTADVPPLSNVESLIIAQAVWEHGQNSWPAIAKILSKHPLISRPKSFFTAQSAHNMYDSLMEQAGFELTEAANIIHAPVNHKLAEKYYRARIEELRELIIAEETNFKALVSEIEDIRNGFQDSEITNRVPEVGQEPENKVSVPETLPDEIFEGSDLSGVTASPPPASQTSEVLTSELPPTEYSPEEPESTQNLMEKASPTIRPEESPPPTVVLEQNSTMEIDGQENHNDDDAHAGDVPANADSPSAGEVPPLEPLEVSDQEEINIQNLASEKEDKREEEEEEEEDEEEEAGGEQPIQAIEKVEAVEAEAEEEEEELKPDEKSEIEMGSPERIAEEEPVPQETSEIQEPATSPTIHNVEVEGDQEIDEGNTSGEEPLQVARRSTRRRRSTLSPVQPLQTRGKLRRQRAESPAVTTKEEPEPELKHEHDELPGGSLGNEIDRDASPVATEPGTSRRRGGKRKASFVEVVDSPRDRKRGRDESEPADEDEPGPSSAAARARRRGDRTEEQVALKRFQNVIGMLHSQISQHRNGNIFHNPIKNSEAPDYHEIVKRPMDLKTIKMKVKDGAIANSLEYQRDIFLMFANSLMYNRPGSDVHTMAEDMMVESEEHILAFRQTEGLVVRRSNRA